MTAKTVAKTELPQSYRITKNTAKFAALIRETLSNNKGKVYTADDLKRVCGKKWVHAFIYYASREALDPNAAEAFPIVSIKKGRKVVGYVYKPLAENVKRNARGHMVKPTAVIGKWEQKLVVRAERAAAEAEAVQAAA